MTAIDTSKWEKGQIFSREVFPSGTIIEGRRFASHEEMLEAFPLHTIADIRDIEHWPNLAFEAEGRRFCYFEDGYSIALRIQAANLGGSHERAEREREAFHPIAGAILEAGTNDPPMVFYSSDALEDAWIELHTSHGVPMTAEEREQLGLLEEDDDEDII